MKPILVTVSLILVATSAIAQHSHQSTAPAETGQAQFAAIAEIVTMLRHDPDTDWSSVDIAALRDHLVDMDNVTSMASVEVIEDGSTVTFIVTGEAEVAGSIQRMVLAHSPMLAQSAGWSVSATPEDDGASMTVQVQSEQELDQVLGLGFFGLMTIGAHHQQHHFMIATGRSPH
ncbi:hypothetical protein [Nereida sp. MMG025]|uniref:hypothetical protein n=1 Tax=Nereida sp. MMG025 TaxID=2909981 RepID=UPI001F382547|nr:hypothetical protein [Nereida sp. MMG025]MCF6445194.1 hypothetical protein [Nereida sp. MMG025]